MDPMALYQSIEANKRRDQEKLSSSMEGVNKAVMMMAQQAMRAELAGERGEAARLKAKAILDAKKLDLEASAEEGRLGREEKQLGRDEDIVKRLEVMMVEDPESYKLYQSKFSPEGAFKGLRGPMGGNRFPAPTATQAAGVPIYTDEEVDDVTFAREARKAKEGEAAAATQGLKRFAEKQADYRASHLTFEESGGQEKIMKDAVSLMSKVTTRELPYKIVNGKEVDKTLKERKKDRDYVKKKLKMVAKMAIETIMQYEDMQELFKDDPALKPEFWAKGSDPEPTPLSTKAMQIALRGRAFAADEYSKTQTKRDTSNLSSARDSGEAKSLARLNKKLSKKDNENQKKIGPDRLDFYKTIASEMRSMRVNYTSAMTKDNSPGTLQGYLDGMKTSRDSLKAFILANKVKIPPTELLIWKGLEKSAETTVKEYEDFALGVKK